VDRVHEAREVVAEALEEHLVELRGRRLAAHGGAELPLDRAERALDIEPRFWLPQETQ